MTAEFTAWFRRRKRRIVQSGDVQWTETLFLDADGWDALYTCEDATADAWTARFGPDLTADATQAVNGSTGNLSGSAIGAGRVNRAAVSSNVDGFGGWRSDGVAKATLTSTSFTIRALIYPQDGESSRPMFWWSNYFGAGDDFYVALQHTASAETQLRVVSGASNATFSLQSAGLTLDAWHFVDIYYQPGVGVTTRVDGVENFYADASAPDVLANGAAGDIGVACRGTTGTVPAPGRTFGVGIHPGDFGLANHRAKAQALGLYTPVATPDPLSIPVQTLAGGTNGATYNDAVVATGGTAPYSWSVVSGELPAGINLSGTGLSGALTGTPTVTGNFGFTLRITDSASNTAERAFTLDVAAPVAAMDIPTGQSIADPDQNVAYSATYSATGGVGPYTWEVMTGVGNGDGVLPTGLALSGTGLTVTISGTPTVAGAFSFRLRVTDSQGDFAESPFINGTVIAASGDPMAWISPASVATQGAVGSPYTVDLEMEGGLTPMTWAHVAGNLPPGVTISGSPTGRTCTLSGTPTTEGSFAGQIRVTDSASNSIQRYFTITINAGGSQTLAHNSNPSLSGGTVGDAYTASVVAVGGTGPYAWNVQAGALPAGLSLGGSTGTAETISGTPTADGTATFTLRVTDSLSATADQEFTLVVAPAVVEPLSITTTTLSGGRVGDAYTQNLVASGGATPYAWSLQSGSLPAGLTLNSAGSITGTPTTAGSATFTLRVTDDDATTVDQAYTLNVVAATALSGLASSNSSRNGFFTANDPFVDRARTMKAARTTANGIAYDWRTGANTSITGGRFRIRTNGPISGLGTNAAAPLSEINTAENSAIMTVPTTGAVVISCDTGTDVRDLVREDQIALFDGGRMWNPEFSDTLHAKSSAIRAMDLLRTNKHPTARTLELSSQRVLLSEKTWTGDGGVPWEAVIQLANEAQKGLWVCIPDEADDAHVTLLATLVRDNLDSGRKLWVEFANETWNGGYDFYHTNRLGQKAVALWGAGAFKFEYAAYRSSQCMDIFRSVLGARPFHSVIAPQSGYAQGSGTEWEQLERFYCNGNPNVYTALGNVTPASKHNTYAITRYWGPNLTAAEVSDMPTTQSAFNDELRTRALASIADRNRWIQRAWDIQTRHPSLVDVVFYEGGSHNARIDAPENPWEQLILNYVQSEHNAECYRESITSLATLASAAGKPIPELFFFTDIGDNYFAMRPNLQTSSPRWDVYEEYSTTGTVVIP